MAHDNALRFPPGVMRVVGRRKKGMGDRDGLDELGRAGRRRVEGVFRYLNHEEANGDWDQ
jgi:hypothetical protein